MSIWSSQRKGGGSGGPGYIPPTVSSETTVSLTTTATAGNAAFVPFSDAACTELELENDTSVEIEYQRNGAGNTVAIEPGQMRRIVGITNANQIGVRRADFATPAVSRPTVVTARALTSNEVFVYAGTLSVNITSGGANTQAGSLACTSAEIINPTGKMIMWRIGSTAPYRKLRARESIVVRGLSNTNQLYFKCYDSVANILRPVIIEAFSSGVQQELGRFKLARQVAPDAIIPLDDLNYPLLFGKERTFLSVLENGDQRQTLIPKDVRPLAFFPTVALTTTNQAGSCVDATTGERLFGSSAVEYTQPGANTIATFAPAAALSAGVDVTGTDIHFEYALPDNAGVAFSGSNLASFSIELYSAGSPGSPGSAFHSASVSASAPGFVKVDARRGGTIVGFSIPIENFVAQGGGATLTSITWARFRIQGGSGAAGAKFRPHSIKSIKKAMDRATIIISFDDLHAGIMNALMLLSKYNYAATCFADATVKIGQTGFLTADQLVTLHQKFGWDIAGQVQGGNGSGPTADTGISAEHAITQVARYKATMKALGISGTQDFSRGSTSFHNASGIVGYFFDNWPTLRRCARTSFEFNGGANNNPPMTISETLPFGDPYAIRRLNMGGFTPGTLLQRWREQTAATIACKGALIWGAHSEFNSPGEALTALATYVEDLRTEDLAGNLRVLSVSQAIKMAY